ncbi:MAG: M48 family metallopeptidase [Fimbriimonadaceae bacterium]
MLNRKNDYHMAQRKETKTMRKQFPDISVEAFVADTDRKALAALQRIPLLPTVITKFHESGFDRWIYCWNMAMSVRCGPKQYGTIYRIAEECSGILDMPTPEIYLTNNPFPNAYTGGVDRPYITLRSSIIDTLTDEQLYHLIGHELGHIKAGHVLYKSVARFLIPILELISRRTLGVADVAQVALMSAFFEWSRQAEITADRAGLLCSQDFSTSASANLMLTGGPNRLMHEANEAQFLDQARTYQDMNFYDSIGKMMVFMFYGMGATHPMPVHRVQQLEHWYESGAYGRIISGNYSKKA